MLILCAQFNVNFLFPLLNMAQNKKETRTERYQMSQFIHIS